MDIRAGIAIKTGQLCEWAMKDVLHRGATTLPGRVAMAVDSDVLSILGEKPACGSIVVCGTNGKTTTTNILAKALQADGSQVLCNWAGANMASGVTSCLLPGKKCDWGVFENDELSTIHVVPKVKPRVLLLLNLFRDQLDRCGEIDHVQDVLVEALQASPQTVLVYDADDPLCQGVAYRVRAAGLKTMAFGIDGDLRLSGDRVTGGGFCQVCGAPLAYVYRQYGQLGKYSCPSCGFERGVLDFAAVDVQIGEDGVSFDAVHAGQKVHLHAPWGGAYMVYNLLGAFAAAKLAEASSDAFQRAVDDFNPKNGRLQHFCVHKRSITLNLAKNPTGFNQNMAMLAGDTSPKAVYIVINDDYNDGKDVSWLWDVDFEKLRNIGPSVVFSGGHRANDMLVRLKYAGVDAAIVDDVEGLLSRVEECPADWHVWVLTNYSALWPVKAALERLDESL